ncbi:DUF6233 domain-containing protein [Streptomyces sp. NPDC004596]
MRSAGGRSSGRASSPAPGAGLVPRARPRSGQRAGVYTRTGDCWNVTRRSRGLPREAALRALAGGAACPRYRPDAELGHLE